LGYQHFKLLERGIPSDQLLRRVQAYSDRKSGPNLAELILPYGFKQAPRKQRFWLLRHFFRPGQVSPFRLRPFYSVLKEHGMLFALPENPFRIDSDHIPATFINGFERRRCSQLSCDKCGYCRDIAAGCVTIDPAWRREQVGRLKQAREKLVDGRLWSV
jgi:hypothetical protein